LTSPASTSEKLYIWGEMDAKSGALCRRFLSRQESN
jgi:hypothetical protein